MFKKLRTKKAQNVAEYALLISLVVAAVIAMQVYAQRALQAKTKDASSILSLVGGDAAGGDFQFDGTTQYEPYYAKQSYNVDTNSRETTLLDGNEITKISNQTRNRAIAGFQESTYNADNENE
jgi:hypothetical protein